MNILLQNAKTIIDNNFSLLLYHHKACLTKNLRTMKTYLFLFAFLCTIFNSYSQYATKSTISFNHYKGLNPSSQQILDSVYHNMSDLNYHCFTLVSEQEKAFHQQSKLLKLTKERAAILQQYYVSEQAVAYENVFIKYGGTFPSLWLFKPKSIKITSGEISLDEKNRQCFSFNPSVDKMITSANGNRFSFPPNAFVTMDGLPVVNQSIDICLFEFMGQKELIYSGLTTDANGRMLETAGSYYIEAKLNGEELRLSKGESYTVEMLAKNSFPDMFTYYGGTKDGLIDWEVNRNEPATFINALDQNSEGNRFVNPQQKLNVIESEQILLNEDGEWDNYMDQAYVESVQAVDFYEMSAGKLGWINCDRFYESKNTSTIAIKVDSDSSMVVRLVFRDINSVMPCYTNSNHKDLYEASGIPTGEKVLVLAYSVRDNNAILGYKEVTIGENKTEFITVNNLTKTRFEGAVAELIN
jgi:hypothetical protein